MGSVSVGIPRERKCALYLETWVCPMQSSWMLLHSTYIHTFVCRHTPHTEWSGMVATSISYKGGWGNISLSKLGSWHLPPVLLQVWPFEDFIKKQNFPRHRTILGHHAGTAASASVFTPSPTLPHTNSVLEQLKLLALMSYVEISSQTPARRAIGIL